MARGITIDDKELVEILDLHKAFVDKTMPQLVRKYARIACVELANRTEPFSVGKGADPGKKARALGDKAVRKGITRVLPEKDYFQFIVDSTSSESFRKKLQGYITEGNWKKFADALVAVGMWKEARVVSSGDFASVHKSMRSKKTGRTLSLRGKMFLPSGDIDGYVKKIQKRVGMSKSGWADCARQIGGTKGDNERGIPAFAKSKKHGRFGSVRNRTANKVEPAVYMSNKIPWIERVCRPGEQKIALKIARDKMIKEANRIIGYAAKNKFQEVDQKDG